MPDITPTTEDDERVIADMRTWLERAVIGLNLCPFAKAVHVKGQIRWVVSHATEPAELFEELKRELESLAEQSAEVTDTTLLIHPRTLNDFLDYNDFLAEADDLVEAMSLDGILQVASFHPNYQFADTDPDDISNYSNRAPYPTLHLLREESIDKAVAAVPDADDIYERNIETLQKLGTDGWNDLFPDQRKA